MSLERFRRSDEVAFRRVGDETLLVPIRTSPQQEMNVFALNEVAAFLWDNLGEPRSAEELSSCLAGSYEVDSARAASDVAEFLARLASKHLIEKAEP